MRRIHVVLIALLGSACAHAGPSTPTPAPSMLAAVEETPASEAPTPAEEELERTAADPNTTVVVMEAEDLGGGPDAIVGTPKRPSLPSMMSDIGMAPSR